MKKKLLFITQYLHTGGIERSLLTLLSDFNYEEYDVDLLLFDHSGVLFKSIPPQVNILPPLFETFTTPLMKAVPLLIKKRKYRLLIGKVLAAVLPRFTKGVGTGIRWSIYRYSLKKQSKHYDVAISYIDFFCNYYVTEKVSADKKIVYNHMDYAFSQKNGWPCPALERKSFFECDHIVSVAESSRDTLISFFPEFSNKIKVIHNRVSEETIRALSEDTSIIRDLHINNKIKIVTIARLVDEKGVFFALDACKLLVQQGYDICWILIGNGPMYEKLNNISRELGIEKNFILLGEKENPYPYIKFSDIYVQPSKTEAHCVAVEEALVLNSSIIVTDIPSFRHQIVDGETGIVVSCDAKAIAEGIKRLYMSDDLRKNLRKNVKKLRNRNQIEKEKFSQLLSISN